MTLLPRRLLRAKAALTIKAECEAPPDLLSGGAALVSVLLLPGESFTINRGWLELSLITTRFSRTVLDGYLEHSTEKLFRTTELCGQTDTRPGKELVFYATVPVPPDVLPEAGPVRLQWKIKARFDVKDRREIRAARLLLAVKPPDNAEPVVDGTGFLPLYELRTGSGR